MEPSCHDYTRKVAPMHAIAMCCVECYSVPMSNPIPLVRPPGRPPTYPWNSTPIGGSFSIPFGSVKPSTPEQTVSRRNRLERERKSGVVWRVEWIGAEQIWRVTAQVDTGPRVAYPWSTMAVRESFVIPLRPGGDNRGMQAVSQRNYQERMRGTGRRFRGEARPVAGVANRAELVVYRVE